MSKKVTTQADGAADTPAERPKVPAESLDTVRRLMTLGRSIDLDIPESLEERKRAAIEMQACIDEQSARLGFLLLAINKECAHGEWRPCLKEAGISKSKAHDHMSVAAMLAGLSESNVRRVGHLPLGKQIKLARLPAEEINAMIDDGTFAAIEERPAEETKELVKMRKRVRDAEQQADDCRAREITLVEELERARHYDTKTLHVRLRRACAEEANNIHMLSVGVLGEIAEAMREFSPDEDQHALGEILANFQWALYATEQQVRSLRRQVAERYDYHWDAQNTPLPPRVDERDIEEIEYAEHLVDSARQSRKVARQQDGENQKFRRDQARKEARAKKQSKKRGARK